MLFSLSLFLLFPAATQCMKRLPSEIQTIDIIQTKKQKTQQLSIAKLQHRRNKLLDALQFYNLKSNNPYLTKHCAEDLLTLIKGFHARNQTSSTVCCMVGAQAWIKICPYVLAQTPITHEQLETSFHELPTKYSLAGLLTMPIKNCFPCPMTYQEKKERLSQFLRDFPDTATPKDQELALVEKWERCAPSIIKTYLNLQHSLFLSEINFPREVIPLITLLMWNTEESLF